jgi:hypothetical protein
VTDLYDVLGELRGSVETVRRLASGRILWIEETSGTASRCARCFATCSRAR